MDLLKFQRPQRYIGNEWNVVKKSHAGKIRICLCYPDLYQLGMSNLGLRILYGLFNDSPDAVCERVFMPGEDLAAYLALEQKPLFSLETKSALKDFDVLCFNFSYELNFTNFLSILSLGQVPVASRERKDIIVVGGGVSNPEPLWEFVDVFFLGEFEEAASKFIDILKRYPNKQACLEALACVEGFYVPKFYSVDYEGNNYRFAKKYPHARLPIKRVHVEDFDRAYYPTKWLTPYTQIVHDRVPLEIARGCPNRCRFCQARSIYSPYRERKISTIIRIAEEIYASSGYEDFSLLALSASDYRGIEGLIDQALEYFQSRRIGISLPSLRVDDILERLYPKLTRLKKTSLTVAVEAARDPLRKKLGKKIDAEKLFAAARLIHSLHIRRMKVYFMFGFASEEEEDLEAIGKFLRRLSQTSKLAVSASINIFIPKPFSLWEAEPMQSQEVLAAKRSLILRDIGRARRIKADLSSIKKSTLEAIISRADRRFSRVIAAVVAKGGVPDCDGHYSWDIWEAAMIQEGIDWRFYLDRRGGNFPWSFIQ